jgi:hypothetical protein
MEREVDQPELPPGGTDVRPEAAPQPEHPSPAEGAQVLETAPGIEPVPGAELKEAEPQPAVAEAGSPRRLSAQSAETGPPVEPPQPAVAGADLALAQSAEAEPVAEQPPAIQLHPGYLVVQGTLEGLDSFILRPVPAAGETSRRLRARSFRAALTAELLLLRVAQRLALTPLLFAGNRFVLAGPAEAGWRETLNDIQHEFDIWLFQHLQPAGEVRCFLAGEISPDGRLPWPALQQGLRRAQLQPLEGALRVGLRWNGRAFVLPAGSRYGRCAGCAVVTQVRSLGEESLCDSCARDSELGERLPAIDRGWLAADGEPELAVPGLALRFSQNGSEHEFPLDAGKWLVLRRLPSVEGRPLSFEQLAGGSKLLGYLYAEVDDLADVFQSLEGEPRRAVQLDQALNAFFGDRLVCLLEAEFPLVYPVFENGSGVLLAGAWQQMLELAVRLNREFGRQVGRELTLSAGLALAHPSWSVASAAGEARERLQEAMAAGGNRLNALGSSVEWQHLPAALQRATAVAAWVRNRAISGAWLNRLASLHAASLQPGDAWRPALAALVRDARIKPGQARVWAARLSHASPDSDWRWAPFLARYASLAVAVERREAEPQETAEAGPAAAEAAPQGED